MSKMKEEWTRMCSAISLGAESP